MSTYDANQSEEDSISENFVIEHKVAPLDASKHPSTLTTTASIKTRLSSKYKVVDIDKHDLQRLHGAIENFTYTLVHTVLQTRQDEAYKAQQEGTASSKSEKVPRAASSELWRALATSPSLRLLAHQFLAFKFVPEEHMHYFSDFTRHFPASTQVMDDGDASDDGEINPLFLDSSSQMSGH